jgi:hypothetical protein
MSICTWRRWSLQSSTGMVIWACPGWRGHLCKGAAWCEMTGPRAHREDVHVTLRGRRKTFTRKEQISESKWQRNLCRRWWWQGYSVQEVKIRAGWRTETHEGKSVVGVKTKKGRGHLGWQGKLREGSRG